MFISSSFFFSYFTKKADWKGRLQLQLENADPPVPLDIQLSGQSFPIPVLLVLISLADFYEKTKTATCNV